MRPDSQGVSSLPVQFIKSVLRPLRRAWRAGRAQVSSALVRLLARALMVGTSGPAPPIVAGLPPGVRRVLWIQLDGLGDILMDLPAVHAWTVAHPEMTVDALVLPQYAAILADVDCVRRVIPYALPRCLGGDSPDAALRETLRVLRLLRRRKYDLALDLRGREKAQLMVVLSGARCRAGLAANVLDPLAPIGLSGALTHPITLESAPGHATDTALAALMSLDPAICDRAFAFPVPATRAAAVGDKLTRLGVGILYVVVHAHATSPKRGWEPHRFARIADHLASRYGFDVLLTGSAQDAAGNERIRGAARCAERVHNVAGAFSLPEMPALLKSAALMVTVDTGPMHIAASVGTPVVSLFLPYFADIHYPYRQRDGVVLPPEDALSLEDYHRLPHTHSYLLGITVESVTEAIDRKLRPAEREKHVESA